MVPKYYSLIKCYHITKNKLSIYQAHYIVLSWHSFHDNSSVKQVHLSWLEDINISSSGILLQSSTEEVEVINIKEKVVVTIKVGIYHP